MVVSLCLFGSITSVYAFYNTPTTPFPNHKLPANVVDVVNPSCKNGNANGQILAATGLSYIGNQWAADTDFRTYQVNGVTTGGKAVSLKAKYANYLKYNNKYYDLYLEITNVYSENSTCFVGINLKYPWVAWCPHSDYRQNGDFLYKVTVTEAGSTTPVSMGTLPLFCGFGDVDSTEIYRLYTTNINDLYLDKNLTQSTVLKYGVGSNYIDIAGEDSEDIGGGDDNIRQKFYYKMPSGNFTVRYGPSDVHRYASGVSFYVLDLNYTVNYQWSGSYPSGVSLPGSATVKNGTGYNVDTIYNTSTTAYRTNTTYNGTTYPRGTWRFNGWDKSGTIIITGNTTIYGSWNFTPEWNITTSVTNGTITPSIYNVPNGQSRTISYSYNTNYVLDSVKVDGRDVSITDYKNSYTFSNITADHTIDVKYIPTYKVEYFTDAGGVSISAHEEQDPNNAASTRPRVVVNRQPQGAELTTSPDWIFDKWTTRKAVTLKDGTEIPANGTITMDQIKQVVVTEDLIFDAHHIPRPQIEITKTADSRYRQNGEDIVYTIKAFNKKPYVDALMLNSSNEYVMTRVYTEEQDIDISDSLPKELKLVNVKARNIGPSLVDGYELDVDTRTNSFSARFAKLTQEEPEFIVRAEVNTDVNYSKDIPNTANIHAVLSRYPTGQDSDDDISPLTVVKPNLKITKTQDKEKYHLSDTIHYTVVVENIQANSHADHVVITDQDLSPGINIKGEVTASAGTVVQNGNSFTVSADELLGEDDITIEFDATIDKTKIESKTASNVASVNCDQLDPREADTSATIVCDVVYEWDDPHPDLEVPESTIGQDWGTDYTVDTSYKTGDKVKGRVDGQKGSWRFNGWDREGTFALKDDVVIKGTWTFIPEYDIVTEVEHGTITPTEIDIPEGETRVVAYTPDEGYQLKELIVNGEQQDIHEYPASYTFENIHRDHRIKAIFELIPELKIVKTSDKEIYNAGDTVTYTITVSQLVEGAEARDVRIKDTLPEGLTLNHDSIDGPVEVVSTEDRSYELLVKSLTDTVTFTYTSTTEKNVDHEELINVADVTGSNVPEPADDDNKVKSLTPKPEITKLISNSDPIYGEEVTYYISVKEPQEGIELRNAVLRDPLPEELEFTEDSITVNGNEATATFEDGNLVVDIPVLSTEVAVSFKATVTAVEGKINNIASLKGDDAEEIQDNAELKVKEPKPTLSKAVSDGEPCIGDEITYTVTATTDIALIDAVIQDKLPEGIALIKDSVKVSDEKAELTVEDDSITIKTDKMDEAIILSYKAKVLTEGTHKNTVSLKAYNFPKGPAEAEAKIKAIYPEPVIEKIASSDIFSVGDTVYYTVTARAAKGRIYNAVITDEIPSGLTLNKDSVKVSSGELSVKDNTITVTKPVLSDPVRITYEVKVEKDGAFRNIATISGENTKEPVKDDAKINAFYPKPLISKTVNHDKVNKGDIAHYVIVAKPESGRIYNAVIEDKLPNNTEIIENSVTISKDNAKMDIKEGKLIFKDRLTVKLDVLEGPVTIEYDVKAVDSGDAVNTAILSGSNLKEQAKADATLKIVALDSPKTGENSDIFIICGILFAAMLAIGVFVTITRRKETQK